jgi:hypothetical protein
MTREGLGTSFIVGYSQGTGSRKVLKCILKNYPILNSTKQVVVVVISLVRTQEAAISILGQKTDYERFSLPSSVLSAKCRYHTLI